MKHEWRKKEKHIYLPKSIPEKIILPEYKFITLKGKGSPANPIFSEYIGVLYSVAYAIKMSLKKMEIKPIGYSDFTVYPLEGEWSLNQKAIKNWNGTLNKDDLIYKLMIRQPDFVEKLFFEEMLKLTKVKKPNTLLNQMKFEVIQEGTCVQMLHIGSYDNERASFDIMETFSNNQGLKRLSKAHREIYLSDFRKVAEDKLKTVLRFKVSAS